MSAPCLAWWQHSGPLVALGVGKVGFDPVNYFFTYSAKHLYSPEHLLCARPPGGGGRFVPSVSSWSSVMERGLCPWFPSIRVKSWPCSDQRISHLGWGLGICTLSQAPQGITAETQI